MRSLHIRAHVDKQGQVTFRMPPEFADQDVDLVVVFEPLKSAEAAVSTSRDGQLAFSRTVSLAAYPTSQKLTRRVILKCGTHWNDLLLDTNACIAILRDQRLQCRAPVNARTVWDSGSSALL